MLFFVKAAFFLAVIFPPPAPRPEIFSLFYRACTGRTTDTYKTTVVQRVVRNIICIDVFAYLFCCPVKQWIVFDDLVNRIPFQLLSNPWRNRMLGPQTRYPHCISGQAPFSKVLLFGYGNIAFYSLQIHKKELGPFNCTKDSSSVWSG
jgi:hypothetical protein